MEEKQEVKPTALSVYEAACGVSEVPSSFHQACLFSATATLLSNRVWFDLRRNKPIFPNLYIMLVGESGRGKGLAISEIDNLLRPFADAGAISIYPGRLTAAFLIHYLSNPNSHCILPDGSTHLMIIAPEFADAVGSRDNALDLVTSLTGLYTGDTSAFIKGAVTTGLVKAGRPLINFLAGSTMSWINLNLSHKVVAGGFLARCLVFEEPPSSKRVPFPIYPDNVDEHWSFLHKWCEFLTQVEGPFTFDPVAKDLYEDWYNHRETPIISEIRPSWNRIPVHAIKIAMILSVMESESLVIQPSQLHEAIALVEQLKFQEEGVINYLNAKPDRSDLDMVADRIRAWKVVSRSTLLRKLSSRGITATRLDDLIATLEARGDVEVTYSQSTRGHKVITNYAWSRPAPRVQALDLID